MNRSLRTVLATLVLAIVAVPGGRHADIGSTRHFVFPPSLVTSVQAQAPELVTDRLIVTFGPVGDPIQLATQLRETFGFEVRNVYSRAIRGMLIRVPAAARAAIADALRAHPDVATVVVDRRFTLTAETAPKGIRRVGAVPGVGVRANTGRDVDIAVLDSGVDFQHPDLAVDQARSAQCINGSPCVVGGDDVYGHGTRVAGVIGALDNESDLVGVAPQARVISVRVFNDSGQSSSGDILAGIDHVLSLNATSDPVEIANMSFREKCTDAAGAYVDCDSDVDLAPLHTAVRNLVTAGTTVVAAAGNDGIDTRYVAPAGFAEVIAVSAMADSDGLSGGTGPSVCTGYFFNACIQSAPDDSFAASFSNFGTDVDVIAPGADELMLMNGGGTVRASGTSFSAPHAAAVAAIFIRDRWNRGEATPLPSIVQQALIETGECSGSALFRGAAECPTPWPQDSDGFFEPLVRADNVVNFGPSTPVHDVAVLSISAPASAVSGTAYGVSVNVKNEGTETESFGVTLSSDLSATISPTGFDVTNLAPGTTTSLAFTWTPAVSGTHTLRATTTVVNGEVDQADNTNAVTSSVSASPIAPTAPTNLTAVPARTSVQLSWADQSDNEASFAIYRCTGRTCTGFQQLATVSANLTSYTNTGLKRNASYRYYVVARNSTGDSGPSNTITVTTLR